MTQVNIFLAEGFEEVEALMAVDLLRRAGIETAMVSITGRLDVTGSHGITVKADALIEEADEAAMLLLPGGMPGTNNLAGHKRLAELLKRQDEEGRMLAAICAGPSVLGKYGILTGKKATCFPGFEDKLEGAVLMNEKVVSDQNIITSKGLGTAIDFALAIIAHFKGGQKAEEIRNMIQYQN